MLLHFTDTASAFGSYANINRRNGIRCNGVKFPPLVTHADELHSLCLFFPVRVTRPEVTTGEVCTQDVSLNITFVLFYVMSFQWHFYLKPITKDLSTDVSTAQTPIVPPWIRHERSHDSAEFLLSPRKCPNILGRNLHRLHWGLHGLKVDLLEACTLCSNSVPH